MIHGVEQLLLKMTQADEFGIYRVTPSGDQLYVLSFDNQEEAEAVAKSLLAYKGTDDKRIKVVNHYPAKTLSLGGWAKGELNTSAVRTARASATVKTPRKNVRGIVQKCQELLYNGKTTKEVVEKLLPLYLAAGRTKEFGTERITDTCKGINH